MCVDCCCVYSVCLAKNEHQHKERWLGAVHVVNFLLLSSQSAFLLSVQTSFSPQGIIRPQCALAGWAWSSVELQGNLGIRRVADLFLAMWQHGCGWFTTIWKNGVTVCTFDCNLNGYNKLIIRWLWQSCMSEQRCCFDIRSIHEKKRKKKMPVGAKYFQPTCLHICNFICLQCRRCTSCTVSW